MPRAREKLTYSNVVATIALFIALGGTAWAVSKDSIKSKHIVNDEVKGADVKAESLKGSDVLDESLTGADVEDGSIGMDDSRFGGALSAQIRDIGSGGDDLYGGISGRTSAVAAPEDVYMALPLGVEIDSLFAWSSGGTLGAGESRTISVVAYPNLIGATSFTPLQCTLTGLQSSCDDAEPSNQYNGTFAIRIESVGAGLDASDDLYVGVAVKAPHDYKD